MISRLPFLAIVVSWRSRRSRGGRLGDGLARGHEHTDAPAVAHLDAHAARPAAPVDEHDDRSLHEALLLDAAARAHLATPRLHVALPHAHLPHPHPAARRHDV